MTGLLDLADEPDPGRGPKCAIAKLSETNPEVYEQLLVVLEDETITAARISRKLKKLDPPVYIAQNRLTYHRRGDCRCGRTA